MNHCSQLGYDRSALRKQMQGFFGEEELHALAFDMGFDHESLSSHGKESFILEFLLCAERSGRIVELVERLASERSQISWDSVLGPHLRQQYREPRAVRQSSLRWWHELNQDGNDGYRRRRFPVGPIVRAGPTDICDDDSEFCGFDYLDLESTLDVVIPGIPPEAQVIAMQVQGKSMEDEHILEGDYVLVHLMDDYTLFEPNSLIVTYYTARDDHLVNADGDADTISITHSLRRGPTLKRYMGWRVDSDGQMYHLLGRPRVRNSQDKVNPYKIEAAWIQPIGKVLALHRTDL